MNKHAEILKQARELANSSVSMRTAIVLRALIEIVERQDERIAEFIDGESQGETDDGTR